MESKSSHQAIVGADGAARRMEKAPKPEKLEPLRPERPLPLTPNERAARAAMVDQRDGQVLVVECQKCKHVSRLQADYAIGPSTKSLVSLCAWCGSGHRLMMHTILQVGNRVLAPASALGVSDRHKTLVRLCCDECHTETEARIEPDAIAQRIPYHCETCWPGSPGDKTVQAVTVITSKLAEKFNG